MGEPPLDATESAIFYRQKERDESLWSFIRHRPGMWREMTSPSKGRTAVRESKLPPPETASPSSAKRTHYRLAAGATRDREGRVNTDLRGD
ncbi:unnamed protein product [Arctogadus glacialis]